jgi:hypothetical protein
MVTCYLIFIFYYLLGDFDILFFNIGEEWFYFIDTFWFISLGDGGKFWG